MIFISICINCKVIAQEVSVVLLDKSKIVLKGYTEYFSFDLKYSPKNNEQIFIDVNHSKDNKIIFDRAEIDVPVNHFRSGNILMDFDFQKMVKSKTYPYVKIYIDTISINSEGNKKRSGTVDISIELAGNKCLYSTQYNVEYDSVLDEYKAYFDLPILLTDFNIEPPKRALGVINVQDSCDIGVVFYFKIKTTKD